MKCIVNISLHPLFVITHPEPIYRPFTIFIGFLPSSTLAILAHILVYILMKLSAVIPPHEV
jgi:hypothetical protein